MSAATEKTEEKLPTVSALILFGHLLTAPAALDTVGPSVLVPIDDNCTRAGQAIGVQDQCDIYSALLDTYMDKAINGDPRAAFMVGLVYMDDDRFTARSLEWFKRSADGGHKNGQYYLGLAYELGEGGLDENHVQAHAWYQLAADQRLGIAKSARDRLSSEMTSEQIAKAEALAISRRNTAYIEGSD